MKCYLNGNILPESEAQLHLNDLALLRGYGIFDYFVFERFQPRFLEDYLNRFFGAIDFLGLQCPLDRNGVRQAVHQLIAANELHNGGIRLLLTGGYTPDGFTPTAGNFFILQSAFPKVPERIVENGARIGLFKHQRELPNVKSINYLTGIYLLPELRKKGMDYPLYHDGQYLRESDRSNFFLVDADGTLVTPKDKILMGITRLKIIELAKELGMPLEEREVKVKELDGASEVFFTSSIKGAVAIVEIDGKAVGNGKPGPKTRALHEAYVALAAAEQVH